MAEGTAVLEVLSELENIFPLKKNKKKGLKAFCLTEFNIAACHGKHVKTDVWSTCKTYPLRETFHLACRFIFFHKAHSYSDNNYPQAKGGVMTWNELFVTQDSSASSVAVICELRR